MPQCITKSNEIKHLESKLLTLSYLSIKCRKFATLKNTTISVKLEAKRPPLKVPKLKFQTLKTTTSTPTTLPGKNPPPGGF